MGEELDHLPGAELARPLLPALVGVRHLHHSLPVTTGKHFDQDLEADRAEIDVLDDASPDQEAPGVGVLEPAQGPGKGALRQQDGPPRNDLALKSPRSQAGTRRIPTGDDDVRRILDDRSEDTAGRRP
jgi:hypothetical protein